MEANLRFPGPETMETKIFARLSAWQNWIFQRPNATGPEGALKLYGTGKQSKYDRKRASSVILSEAAAGRAVEDLFARPEVPPPHLGPATRD